MFPLSGVSCTSDEIASAWAAGLWSFTKPGRSEILSLMLAGSAGYSCLICMHRIPSPRHLHGEASGMKCRSSVVMLSSYLDEKKKKEIEQTRSSECIEKRDCRNRTNAWSCGMMEELWEFVTTSLEIALGFLLKKTSISNASFAILYNFYQRQEVSFSVVLSCWKNVGGFECAVDWNYVWGVLPPAFCDGSQPIIWHSEGSAGVQMLLSLHKQFERLCWSEGGMGIIACAQLLQMF